MELIWEDIPSSDDTPFFTRDVYDKFSLAPTMDELFAIAQSSTVKDEPKDKSKKKSEPPPSTENKSKGNDNIRDNKKSGCLDSHDTEDRCSDSKDNLNDTQSATAEDTDSHCHASDLYPEPRVPFPCVSSLTSKEQLIYLRVLTSKQAKQPPQSLQQQSLQQRVNSEMSEFMRYLQEVARMCAEDYNYVSQGAVRYSEEYLGACLEHVKSYPQLYLTHDMTSLTGGTFSPGLSLTFEKQLLTMGNVEITDHKMLPNNAQLPSDYERVSSEHPPAKKAKQTHTGVSSDSNAEKLCGRYEPHVCLTKDALVRLLNNHGPEFSESWELPVRVKMNPGKGSSQSRTVYVDSPLLKTEMTVRERSHLYHEESLKLSIKNDGFKNVFHVMTEAPATDKQLPVESSQRSLVSFENTGLDFEIHLTDLETFGESTQSLKRPTNKTEQNTNVQSREPGTSGPWLLKSRGTVVAAKKTKRSQENEEVNSSWTEMEEEPKEKPTETDLSEQKVPQSPAALQAERLTQDSVQESEEMSALSGDSEDERLVIDDSPAPTTRKLSKTKPQARTEATLSSSDKPQSSSTEAIPETPRSPPSSSQKARTRRIPASTPKRVARSGKVAGDCDQLGQILRMQKAMLKPAHSHAQNPAKSELLSPSRAVFTPGHPHPQSLVKHCVSSFLESSENLDRERYLAAPSGPSSIDNLNTSQPKRLLSEDLMVSAEDEQDYEAPEEGNMLYKLYSLQDVLLMVCSSVLLAHSRRVGSGPAGTSANKIVPVHVLAKMEYQLCHGVECLTKNEACQLWAETLLHSSTVSYVCHINAHTSNVALLRKLPADWKQNASCDFKPSKSLNILHHLLKKMTGLEEGHYMLRHKAGDPFVTILKAADGNPRVSVGVYDLQQAHSAVPQPPALGLLPWVPVDPAVVLPFHQKHGRVPCTFPPRDLQHAQKAGRKGPGKGGAGGGKGPGKGGAGGGQGPGKGGAGGGQGPGKGGAGGGQGPGKGGAGGGQGKKKKNKGQRAKRREKWIQKHIQRAAEKPSQ